VNIVFKPTGVRDERVGVLGTENEGRVKGELGRTGSASDLVREGRSGHDSGDGPHTCTEAGPSTKREDSLARMAFLLPLFKRV
jgi:hypothetical protein